MKQQLRSGAIKSVALAASMGVAPGDSAYAMASKRWLESAAVQEKLSQKAEEATHIRTKEMVVAESKAQAEAVEQLLSKHDVLDPTGAKAVASFGGLLTSETDIPTPGIKRQSAMATKIAEASGAAVALEDVGALESVQAALKSHYTGRKLTYEEAFEKIDAEGSGYLDEGEIRVALGLLGLGGLSDDDVSRVVKIMDPDGDGKVTKKEFEEWWVEAIEGGSVIQRGRAR